MKAAVFILLPNTTSFKALQNNSIGFYYSLKNNTMLHLKSAAFFISGIPSYQIRNFTILTNVCLLCRSVKNYETGSNYSNLKKEQYRSIIEC
jgi:hypothetical protein